jgi:glutamate-ammonia-ligase adenylyltransferase
VRDNLSFCPEPERAGNNLDSFLDANPDYAEALSRYRDQAALLFSYSQFLANYCIRQPEELFRALDALHIPLVQKRLIEELREIFVTCNSVSEGMRAVRLFKKKKTLIITLKDVLKKASLQETLLEMSALADAVLSESLDFIEPFLRQRYGAPEDNSLVVISLGKLGAEELNYSSDVDIIFVYRKEGETTGVPAIQGALMNRVTAFEYYTKLVEEYTRFLSANTEDGFAYRVDLRLRPQGQRGGLAMSLDSHEEYYESWGQLWERAAFLRARPSAGDMKLGEDFLGMIRRFVFRKYLDEDTIEEIRRMKSQVEQLKSGTLGRDIKRGYGGIREIEFFIQIFQLIYGGRDTLVRERSTFKALHRLQQKGLIGHDDYRRLSDNYIFLRTLEHRLQQMNDLQTHSLPSGTGELEHLGRRMSFPDSASFLAELNARRRETREIYDSLLETGKSGEERDVGVLSRVFWDMETPVEYLLAEELSRTGITDTGKAIRCLVKIRNNIYSFRTIKGRRLLEDIIPLFVDEALRGDDPDAALLQLVDFSDVLSAREAYLEAISQRRQQISALNFIFSHSVYLSKLIMGSPAHLEAVVGGDGAKKSLPEMKMELSHMIETQGLSAAVRFFRKQEEIRLGVLFMDRVIGIRELFRALSKTAEAVLSVAAASLAPNLTVIALGKLGGREITFKSDLDVIFVTRDGPSPDDIRSAENLLKLLMSYTKDGAAYHMDTRLRPEGNKGPLVVSREGLSEYYINNAHPWELQALLKARVITSDSEWIGWFRSMRSMALRRGIGEVSPEDMKRMRERMEKEISKGSAESDLKFGSGGIVELEFSIQYLQLMCRTCRSGVFVQGTPEAVRALCKAGALNAADAEMLTEIYILFRTVETLLRLQGGADLRSGGSVLRRQAGVLGMTEEALRLTLEEKRKWMNSFWDRVVSREGP